MSYFSQKWISRSRKFLFVLLRDILNLKNNYVEHIKKMVEIKKCFMLKDIKKVNTNHGKKEVIIYIRCFQYILNVM